MAKYEANFIELSHFALELISMKSLNTYCFLDGLNLFLWEKLLVSDLEVYSKVINKAFLAEKGNERIR